MEIIYQLYLITGTGIAIADGVKGEIYRLDPPYDEPKEISYSEYREAVYSGSGVVYPAMCFPYEPIGKLKQRIEDLKKKHE